MIKRIFVLLFITTGFFAFGQQNDADSAAISAYLYKQLKYTQERISCHVLDSVSTIEFYSTKMEFLTGDGGSAPTTYYLYKCNGQYKPVYSSTDFICTPDFIGSLNEGAMIEDMHSALKFQELLDAVDSRNNISSKRKIFKKGDEWYFIRTEFFDKYSYFLVQTVEKGKIKSIEYVSDSEGLEVPEDVTISKRHRAEWGYTAPYVSSSDAEYLKNYLDEHAHFHFEFANEGYQLVSPVTSANFYKAKIVFTEGNSSMAIVFYIMKNGNKILHADAPRNLLKMPDFFASLNPDFRLKNENDALVFEKALDIIDPVSTFDADEKECMQKDGKWYFVRGESFGDKEAYIVETDGQGKITAFTFNNKAITGSE